MTYRFSSHWHYVFFVLLSFVSLSGTCHAASKSPAWELGVALGGQALRDYRGSSESQVQVYPIPFLVYRGDFFKIDRNGVRGEFLSNDRVQFNLSGETALNGSSDDNELRQGMPELESAFELGPSVNINLSGDDFSRGWQLRLPLRAVITAGESGIHSRGYNFNPRFTYTKPDFFGDWRGRVNIGGLFGSKRYHDYYYSVDEQYVTPFRASYEASGGFSGYYFKTSLSRRKDDFWYAASFRYDNLSGASFEDSPVVETKDYFSISFIVAWLGWQSK
ncbi:MAG: MipA/OmpV family protein [Agarilytica sp.]